jgi:membrane associated rhomboid family serine protease
MHAPRSTRRPLPPWLRPISERFSPVVKALALAVAVPFLVYALIEPLRPFIRDRLALGPFALLGAPWQIATALFVEQSALGLLNIVGLWFVGASIERALGTRRFLLMFFAAGLASNLAVAVLLLVSPLPFAISGCGDAVLALFVALGALYGPTQVRVIGNLVVRAQSLAWFFVIFSIVMAAAARALPLIPGTVLASAIGYLLAGGRGKGLGDLWARWRHKSRRSRYQVLDGGRGAGRKDFFN